MRRIGKYFSLSTSEKILFFRALLLVVIARGSLQLFEFKKVVKWFSGKATRQSHQVKSVSPSQITYLLNAATRFIPPPVCLSQSLAGSVLFRSCGYQTTLHIGVTRDGGSMLAAHAWLTLDGEVVLGDRRDLDRYKELPFVFDFQEGSAG